jgi:hypothetical protein
MKIPTQRKAVFDHENRSCNLLVVTVVMKIPAFRHTKRELDPPHVVAHSGHGAQSTS